MGRLKTLEQYRRRRHQRLRRKIRGSAERPRMVVCRSLQHLYVQFIDDDAGHTLCSVSTLDRDVKKQNIRSTREGAEVIGRIAGERAKEKGITEVVCDDQAAAIKVMHIFTDKEFPGGFQLLTLMPVKNPKRTWATMIMGPVVQPNGKKEVCIIGTLPGRERSVICWDGERVYTVDKTQLTNIRESE